MALPDVLPRGLMMPEDDDPDGGVIVAVREFVAGSGLIVAAGFATRVLFDGSSPVGPAVVMAVVCGVVSALVTDWTARLGVTLVTMADFAGFVAAQADSLAGDEAPWPYVPVIVLAAVLGYGYRSISRVAHPIVDRGDQC